MTKTAKILGVCISDRKGIPKTNVGTIRLIENYGVENDAHAGLEGFEKRQVSMIGIETHRKVRKAGIITDIGAFAENICTEGVILYELPIGTKMKIQDIELEVTQIGKECHAGCAIKKTIGDCPMPREGIFVRVIKGGEISVGDTIEII
jgi:MOSC domain-containing protein YiiM